MKKQVKKVKSKVGSLFNYRQTGIYNRISNTDDSPEKAGFSLLF